jgi:hypothetical protein
MRLRTAAVFAGILCLCASSAFAQGNDIGVGVKVGMSLAKISIDPDDGTDSDIKMGFVGGVALDLPITRVFSVFPEILYVQGGSEFSVGSEDGEELKAKLNYINVPILFKGNILPSSRFRPFVVAGPVFGFKAGNAELEFDDEGLPEEDTNFDENSSGVNFGIAVGAGVNIWGATLEARYDYGLKDINKDDVNKGYSRNWLLLLGFQLGGN